MGVCRVHVSRFTIYTWWHYPLSMISYWIKSVNKVLNLLSGTRSLTPRCYRHNALASHAGMSCWPEQWTVASRNMDWPEPWRKALSFAIRWTRSRHAPRLSLPVESLTNLIPLGSHFLREEVTTGWAVVHFWSVTNLMLGVLVWR